MTVDPVSGRSKTPATNSDNSTANGTNSAQAAATLNYTDFLQLLIAQMKSQDPTSPMDASTQISQLASFSQVEQQIQSNAKLDSIISQSGLDVAQSYIGKYLTTSDDKPVSGYVESVKVNKAGVVATLKDGTQVSIGTGVSVSDAEPTKPVKS